MALILGDNFSYQGAKPLDARLKYDTLASMKAVADSTIYDGCLAYCVGTEKTYQWKSTNSVDPTLGKWREFESGGGGGTGSGITIDATLLASGWNSSTNQQTVTFTGYESSMGGVIGMPVAATAAQKEAFATAAIDVVSVSGTSFTFQCETVPSVDLPVTLYAGGSGGSGSGVPAGGTAGQVLAKKSNTDGDVEWKDVANPTQVSTMPAASAANLGQIVQFVGTTNANYTNGLFYECVSDGQSTPTYSWEQKDVQSYPETDLTNVFASGFPVASVSGARPFSYSTDEQIVGTWIDGKPLYQRTFEVTTDATAKETRLDLPTYIPNMDQMFISEAFLRRTNGASVSINAVNGDDISTADVVFICYIEATKKLYIRTGTSEYNRNAKVYATIRYTKTTD